MTNTTHFGNRYHVVNQLGAGGMGTVYRAMDRFTGQPVAIKCVTPEFIERNAAQATDSDSDFRLILAREFKFLASLRHPHIISVLDYGFDNAGQPFYTMDLLEQAETIVAASSKLPPHKRLALLIQMLQAVDYLHRRGIIHSDLKPENVLVKDGQVKVLDFGLAMTNNSSPVGMTLLYTAPEILEEAPLSPASDLYSIGMIGYEMLVGQHPFDDTGVTELMMAVMYTMPDLTILSENVALQAIFGRLLAKDVTDRFDTARMVINELMEATDESIEIELQPILESFLQAAEFVGRETELASLSAGLTDTLEGRGSAWLIGGESGVGKSRLLDELRTLALVRGMLVVRGQCIAEGGAPYRVWRDIVRYLCLNAEISEADASVLKLLVPDIAKLQGREADIPDAPKIEPQASLNRLLAAVERLFRHQTQPLLVILEDLHWASESLTLLAHLNRLVGELPLQIVGSYRDDERPNLPAVLPEMQVLKLKRLATDEIARLSASMLGHEVGRQERIVDMLTRETEGNVLFIVEVVRALAESAGHLDKVGTITLPTNIFAGGIRQIVRHQLSRLPESAHALLQIAAVAGRQLDLAVLRAVNPQADLESWLVVCASAAVLEVQGSDWRFAHDKLREGILIDLTPDQMKILYLQVAQALEQVYGHDLSAYFTVLGRYYEQAGNLSKAIDYLEQAAEQAVLNYANADAIFFFHEALRLVEQLQPNNRAATSAQLLRQASWERQLGELALNTSDIAESSLHFERALSLLAAITGEQTAALREIAIVHKRLVGIYLHSGAWDTVEITLRRTIQLYRQIGDDEHGLEVQLDLAWVYLLQAKFAQARTEFDTSLAQITATEPRLWAIGLLGRAATQLDAELELTSVLADIDAALALLDTLEPSLNASLYSVAYGLRAVVYRRLGDDDTAFTWATNALNRLAQNDLDTHFILEKGYAALCGTLLDLLQINSGAEQYAQPAQEACRALQKFAQIVSIARPRAWLEQSRYSALTGKTAKALRTLEVALSDAQQLNMPYHIGLAHAFKGQMLPTDDPQRLDHLQQAAQYFATLGAKWDEQQILLATTQTK